MRELEGRAFEEAFREVVLAGRWQEHPSYYPRYRSRYEAVLRSFAETASSTTLKVLEVGGGQLAALAVRLWGDRATVADLDDMCFATLNEHGVQTVRYNLASQDFPLRETFDAILLSEVIEHLPVPGHVALTRLRATLRPGGTLV